MENVQSKYGDRAFAPSGPKLWYALPAHIRNCDTIGAFMTALKTILNLIIRNWYLIYRLNFIIFTIYILFLKLCVKCLELYCT